MTEEVKDEKATSAPPGSSQGSEVVSINSLASLNLLHQQVRIAFYY